MKTTKRARREAKGLFRLCVVDGLLDEQRVQRVTQSLAEAKTHRRLAILTCFLRLAKLYVVRHSASVQSVGPLPQDLQIRFRTELTRVYGDGLATSFTERSALIGGVRVEVANDVYDGSIRAGLNALEASV